MEGITIIEQSPTEVDFYSDKIKLASVINGSVIFYDESTAICNEWSPKQIHEFSACMAPVLVKMLKLPTL